MSVRRAIIYGLWNAYAGVVRRRRSVHRFLLRHDMTDRCEDWILDRKRKIATFGGVALVLAACASDHGPTPTAEGPAPVYPELQTPMTNAALPVSSDPNDQCGAASLKYLIGRPKSDVPIPADLSNRRVACTTCPVSQDVMPKRLNIFFDQGTGVVKEVKCG